MHGLKQRFGPRTALSGLKRSAEVFFSQAESFNGCVKNASALRALKFHKRYFLMFLTWLLTLEC